MSEQNDLVTIHVDAACVPNPGWAAYACLLEYQGHRRIVQGIIEGMSTNQRAEITAAIEGLKALKRPSNVLLISDSQYVIKTMQGDWRMKTNIDLWQDLQAVASQHEIEWLWVKGHSGNPQNETVDALANKLAVQAYKESQK